MSQPKANTKGAGLNRLDRLLLQLRRPTRPQVEDNVAKAPTVRPALHLRPVRGRAKHRVENKKDMGPTPNPGLLRVDLHPGLSESRENQRVERRKARKLLRALAPNKRDKAAEDADGHESESKIHPSKSVQSAVKQSRTRFSRRDQSSSAICTAFKAAPLSNWSPDTQKESPFSKAQSMRTRPTWQLSFPATLSGIG
jgi:hypothetical protein